MDPVGIEAPIGAETMRRLVAEVGTARQTLADARARIDCVVAELPGVAEEAMATPELLLLLVGAVTAKARLAELEIQLNTAGDQR